MNRAVLFLVLILSLALVCPALAQPVPGGGRGMGPRLYNPKTVTTVKGIVEKLEALPGVGRGGGRGLQFQSVVLKTNQGSLTVHLGPAWFLAQNKFVLKAGDMLEATGSKVTLNNQPALIAREIKANGQTLTLRDAQGFPMWRGRGRGPGGGQGGGPAGK
ncbi:MAG TPA: hypothetical protein VE082_09545 [Desulfobaccales bacterium]|nr:hypothetical protein [Desulfobaccales bacterium]